MKVFVDAGHGGRDNGAVSKINGLKEKDVNLDLAMRLGKILQSLGHSVNYSRTTDVYVSLSERARMANSWGADYFISVHQNSAENPQANGTETLYYKPNTQAQNMAGFIQEALVNSIGRRDRGTKQQNLAVLRQTNMPANLVEIAFISNPDEAYLLSSASFKQKAAQGIADGFQNYQKNKRR